MLAKMSSKNKHQAIHFTEGDGKAYVFPKVLMPGILYKARYQSSAHLPMAIYL